MLFSVLRALLILMASPQNHDKFEIFWKNIYPCRQGDEADAGGARDDAQVRAGAQVLQREEGHPHPGRGSGRVRQEEERQQIVFS